MFLAKQTLAVETSRTVTFFRDTAIVILSSIIIGLFANVAIPLPFTPVPLATQGSLILVMAAFLGCKRAVAATLAFLAQGAIGLPVFAGGIGGIALLLGPRGGYLIGYLVAAYVVGRLVEKFKERTLSKAFIAMAAGNVVIFVFGASYLSTFIGFKQALLLGVAPFIAGDLLKLAAGLKILEWLGWKK